MAVLVIDRLRYWLLPTSPRLWSRKESTTIPFLKRSRPVTASRTKRSVQPAQGGQGYQLFESLSTSVDVLDVLHPVTLVVVLVDLDVRCGEV